MEMVRDHPFIRLLYSTHRDAVCTYQVRHRFSCIKARHTSDPSTLVFAMNLHPLHMKSQLERNKVISLVRASWWPAERLEGKSGYIHQTIRTYRGEL